MGRENIGAEGGRICTLQEAYGLLADHLHRTLPQKIDLGAALGRTAFADIAAAEPVPAFAESARDGYAIAAGGAEAGEFLLVDEIAAGRVEPVPPLAAATACRIMTGGLVPEGSERVVPYEQCAERDGRVVVPEHLLRARSTHIRRAGSEIARGDRLVEGGVRLLGEHLELLASCGIASVDVAARPSVGYFCTGSELLPLTAKLRGGQKVSSNTHLLAGILAFYGAALEDFGTAGDSHAALSTLFVRAGEWSGDVLVSTGGMGPGKYDLVEKSFIAAGGVVFYRGLAMRPGKATLFGILGRTLFFALPGPPHAVRTLLHTLVGPALLAMQGAMIPWPGRTRAFLLHTLDVRAREMLQLKDGILALTDGRCGVRLAGRLEVPNCHILLPPGRSSYQEGDEVEIQLIGGSLIPT